MLQSLRLQSSINANPNPNSTMRPKRSDRESHAGDSTGDNEDNQARKRFNFGRNLSGEATVSGEKSVRHEDEAEEEIVIGGESSGLRLLGLLLQCAEAVSMDNLDEASGLLPEISELASPFGSSPERVAAYFAEALQARIISSCLAIFQALEAEDRVHVIDLDIMQGLQWPGLFHILASRSRKIRSMRITGVGSSIELLEATGRRLSDFANSLGLPFEFHALEGKVGNITDLSRLAPRQHEATVVHWMHHCLYDITGSDLGTLRLLNLLKPKLITIVEQDLSHSGRFLGRFVEALHYYSALFDALGDGLGGDSVERHQVEQQLFGSEIRNIVAVGGPKRTGEVKVERWADELRRIGFRPVSLGGNPAAQASLLLGMFPWKGYTLVEESGCLKLGWKDLSLLTASAWQPSDQSL
uniref:Scarecrow-like protein 23 n=1 Tax=Nelumbo nucifera TaxID=4432 RepID=A0A822ZG99_NELNU|nr:TPA_asm: hypothetical protein HUJ06_002137 [Nelumbo nucifera]